MSVASLTSIAHERDTGRPWGVQRRSTKAAGTHDRTVEASKTEILVSFIPTEILTGYLAAVATVASTTTDNNPKLFFRWVLFILFALLTPLAIWATWRAKRRSDERRDDAKRGRKRVPLLEMVAATTAFTVWANALPSSPITAWAGYDRACSAVAIIVAGILLTLLVHPTHRHHVGRARSEGLRLLPNRADPPTEPGQPDIALRPASEATQKQAAKL
jgi:hypothetical protein